MRPACGLVTGERILKMDTELKPEMIKKFEKLDYAKDAVMTMLKKPDCLVDFHGLAYWASEVERLRNEIKELL